jgi:hypothetical protein
MKHHSIEEASETFQNELAPPRLLSTSSSSAQKNLSQDGSYPPFEVTLSGLSFTHAAGIL